MTESNTLEIALKVTGGQASTEEIAKLTAECGSLEAAMAKVGPLLAGQALKVQQAAAKSTTSIFQLVANSRMALMQMEHSARASLDILANGGSWRMLAAQVPQVAQAFSLAGVAMSRIIPVIAGVTAVAATGYVGWKVYSGILHEVEENATRTAKSLSGVQTTFATIGKLQSAGALSAKDAGALFKMLHPESSSYTKGGVTYSFDKFDPDAIAKIEKELMAKGLAVPGKDGASAELSPLAKALIELQKAKLEIAHSSDTDEEKKLAESAKKYQELTDKVREFGTVAVAAGQLSSAGLERMLGDIRAADNAETARIEGDIAFKKQQDLDREAARAAEERARELAKQATDEREALERQLTLQVLQQHMTRREAAEFEFKERIRLEDSLVYQGITNEGEYTKAVEKFTADRLRVLEDENNKVLHMLADRRRDEDKQIESGIRDTPFLTEAQKYGQLRDAGYLTQKDGADPNNLHQQMKAQLVDLQNTFGTSAQHIAKTFTNVIGAGISSVSQGISGLIQGTMSWGQAMQNVGTAILNVVVQAIVEMFAAWVTGRNTVTLAELAAQAKELPGKVVSAVTTAIDTYGTAAVVGLALGLAAVGAAAAWASGAFESGGYTGNGGRGQVAGVVHGQEYVFSAPAVDRIGLHNLEAMHNGRTMPSAFGSYDKPQPITIVVINDPAMIMNATRNIDGDKWFVDMARKNRHHFM